MTDMGFREKIPKVRKINELNLGITPLTTLLFRLFR